jgi:hypothetical protein
VMYAVPPLLARQIAEVVFGILSPAAGFSGRQIRETSAREEVA